MMTFERKLRRRCISNIIAGLLALALSAYIAKIWMGFRVEVKCGSVGWVVLFIAFLFLIISILYLVMAYLMRFRYVANLPVSGSIILKKLQYEGDRYPLAVMWHAGGVWLTVLANSSP